MQQITQHELKRLLDYNQEEGSFTWKWRDEGPACWNGRWPGKAVGSIVHNSQDHDLLYLTTRIKGYDIYVHRLVWLWEYNTLPEFIDHKDGDGLNNHYWNLRESTRSQNLANSHKLQRGVYIENGKCRAMIRVEGNLIHLGTFTEYDDAQAAYNKAANEYFGEYARINR